MESATRAFGWGVFMVSSSGEVPVKDSLKTRLGRLIENRKTRIRFETAVILLLAYLVGWGLSTGLWHLGFDVRWARYAVSTLVGYLVFLGLYFFWFQSLARELSAGLQTGLEAPSVPDAKTAGGPDLSPLAELFGWEEAGLVAGLVVLVVTFVLVVAMAPVLVLDLATGELLILLALARLGSIDPGTLFGDLVKNTLVVFVVVLALLVGWALVLG